jgi:hypothetical protein
MSMIAKKTLKGRSVNKKPKLQKLADVKYEGRDGKWHRRYTVRRVRVFQDLFDDYPVSRYIVFDRRHSSGKYDHYYTSRRSARKYLKTTTVEKYKIKQVERMLDAETSSKTPSNCFRLRFGPGNVHSVWAFTRWRGHRYVHVELLGCYPTF